MVLWGGNTGKSDVYDMDIVSGYGRKELVAWGRFVVPDGGVERDDEGGGDSEENRIEQIHNTQIR